MSVLMGAVGWVSQPPAKPAAIPAIGTCLDFTIGDTLRSDTPTVDCTQPHTAEIIEIVDLSAETDYPTDARFREAAQAACPDLFVRYVGSDPAASELKAMYMKPSVQAWSGGTRLLLCWVTLPNGGQLTLSVQGTLR